MDITQPEKIILIPPSHEQSAPTFQLVQSLAEPFLQVLEEEGVPLWKEPTDLNKPGPNDESLVQIEVDPKQSLSRLEQVLKQFETNLARHQPAK
jgi:hypothetical protein